MCNLLYHLTDILSQLVNRDRSPHHWCKACLKCYKVIGDL
jgi:hypothetical protein